MPYNTKVINFMTSFIILNFNTSELASKCVDSILRYFNKEECDIIVVDNGSSAEEKKFLHQVLDKKCRIVESRINQGFGAGNMLGANFAKGDFLCFLNSDVELVEDCITPLCQYLNEHQDVGCVTPQQYDGNGNHARSFRHKTGIRHELFGDSVFEKWFPKKYPSPDDETRTAPLEVSQINGSFMLFPADKFLAIGGFDINIFLYYEEYDVGIRLMKHGWKNVVIPTYRFLHLYSAAIRKSKSKTYRELYISKIYTYSKHHNRCQSLVYRILNILPLLVKPKKWYILSAICHCDVLAQSMRHQISAETIKRP